MVRSFILNPEQREAIEDYLRERPNAMTSQIRQIRLRAKRLVANEMFGAMESDIELLRRLAALKIPKGRKALDVKASFTVRGKYDPILDDFLDGPHETVKVEIDEQEMEGQAGYDVTRQLNIRIKNRKLEGKIKASTVNDEVYLEKLAK